MLEPSPLIKHQPTVRSAFPLLVKSCWLHRLHDILQGAKMTGTKKSGVAVTVIGLHPVRHFEKISRYFDET